MLGVRGRGWGGEDPQRWEVLTVVWLSGRPGGLGGQHVAPAPEGEADGSHECHCGDEVPKSEEVRPLSWQWEQGWGDFQTRGGWQCARAEATAPLGRAGWGPWCGQAGISLPWNLGALLSTLGLRSLSRWPFGLPASSPQGDVTRGGGGVMGTVSVRMCARARVCTHVCVCAHLSNLCPQPLRDRCPGSGCLQGDLPTMDTTSTEGGGGPSVLLLLAAETQGLWS